MQSKSPAPGCNVSLVGSNQARVTVANVGTKVTQPMLSSGLGRGVVITPLSTQNQRVRPLLTRQVKQIRLYQSY